MYKFILLLYIRYKEKNMSKYKIELLPLEKDVETKAVLKSLPKALFQTNK